MDSEIHGSALSNRRHTAEETEKQQAVHTDQTFLLEIALPSKAPYCCLCPGTQTAHFSELSSYLTCMYVGDVLPNVYVRRLRRCLFKCRREKKICRKGKKIIIIFGPGPWLIGNMFQTLRSFQELSAAPTQSLYGPDAAKLYDQVCPMAASSFPFCPLPLFSL